MEQNLLEEQRSTFNDTGCTFYLIFLNQSLLERTHDNHSLKSKVRRVNSFLQKKLHQLEKTRLRFNAA
ncbi:hypothetical protein EUGRSUZ_H03896 [Eucalyptus grandis]|uniref:Uncharacterized protein n=2 Tax=Eucalyptus grandis TaxID=71139 RepID=A0ACC3JWC9_EUCGR|nr:hypothetical protein EUGRSUZ_H03896 [Eucalyptus grandis]